MALTEINNKTVRQDIDIDENTLYYGEDMLTVLQQGQVHSSGFISIQFRGDAVTIFAAKDKDGKLFRLAALPCPPYYHEDMPEARAGNVLKET